jgi:hypothetical protein
VRAGSCAKRSRDQRFGADEACLTIREFPIVTRQCGEIRLSAIRGGIVVTRESVRTRRDAREPDPEKELGTQLDRLMARLDPPFRLLELPQRRLPRPASPVLVIHAPHYSSCVERRLSANGHSVKFLQKAELHFGRGCCIDLAR